MSNKHPHLALIQVATKNFSLLCDAFLAIDFAHLSDDEFAALYKSLEYGSLRLSKHLETSIHQRFKKQVKAFIDNHKRDCPILLDIDMAMFEGERLRKLHHLLFTDPLPLFKKLPSIRNLCPPL